MYTVSPYARLKLAAAYPPVPSRISDLAQQEMQDLFRVRDLLEKSGKEASLVTLRRGLMPAPDKSVEECMKALPRPGAYLEPARVAPHPKAARKKARGKSARTKK